MFVQPERAEELLPPNREEIGDGRRKEEVCKKGKTDQLDWREGDIAVERKEKKTMYAHPTMMPQLCECVCVYVCAIYYVLDMKYSPETHVLKSRSLFQPYSEVGIGGGYWITMVLTLSMD